VLGDDDAADPEQVRRADDRAEVVRILDAVEEHHQRRRAGGDQRVEVRVAERAGDRDHALVARARGRQPVQLAQRLELDGHAGGPRGVDQAGHRILAAGLGALARRVQRPTIARGRAATSSRTGPTPKTSRSVIGAPPARRRSPPPPPPGSAASRIGRPTTIRSAPSRARRRRRRHPR
jgi:hypothetical protein